MLTDKTFDTGAVTLAYLENDSTAPPIVLLHGLTGWRADWREFTPLLDADWHVYVPELRGHGNSGRAGSYTLADYSLDIIAFLKHIGEPVVLAGLSLGGLVALAVAAQYPAGLRALVMLDPPLLTGRGRVSDLPGEMPGYFRFVHETVKAAPSYESVLARCAEMLPPEAGEAAVRAMADQVSRVAPGTLEDSFSNRMWQGFELGALLRQVTTPTLMIHGDVESGAAVSEDDADFVRQQLPAARVIRIPNAGHLIPVDHPAFTLQSIEDLLRTS